MSKWWDIESAPRDGTKILANGPGWESEQRIYWVEDEEASYWEFCETVLASVEPEADPSHWMFPPDPPDSFKK